MSVVCLGIGTILGSIFLYMMLKGQKYDYMLESLSGDAFPIKMIYSAGLYVQDFRIARLKGQVGDKLRKSTTLYYSKQYSEFYARIIWAQVISFSWITLAIFLILSGVMEKDVVMFYVLFGMVASVLMAYYFLTYTGNKIAKRKEECEKEFPNVISKLALMVNSGVILHDAWEMIAYSKKGSFYELMREACVFMKNGKADIEAIHEFGVLTNSDDIKKFTSALIQNIERGGGDLPIFLINQSSELWQQEKQRMLQKGEKAAGALLMPIAIMFLGTMLIVIAAAMQSFGV